jgi:hypothetical protein
MDEPPEKRPLDLYHQAWAIQERARIQHTLLALYAYVLADTDTSDSMRYVVADNLIAAAFALWRAVFLAADLRTNETVRKRQENFLATVIENNAITFGDDKRNSPWTFGFYVEAAKWRLKHADYVLREGLNVTPEENVEQLMQLSGFNMIAYTRYEWMCVHRALRVLFRAFHPGSQLELPGTSMAISENDNFSDRVPSSDQSR